MLPHVDIYRRGELDYLLMNSSDHISDSIRKHGQWSSSEVTICKVLLRGRENQLVIDAGANIGGFALPVAKFLETLNGSIVCFEPQRIVFQQLCANIFFNRIDNAYTHNVAVGDELKSIDIPELDFKKSKNIGGFSINKKIRDNIAKETKGSKYENFSDSYGKNYNVSQIPLDNFGFFDNVGFIKVDIEGFELEFFKGATKTITSNNFPPIIFELWKMDWYKEKAAQTLNILEEMGYSFEELGEEILAQHPKFHRRVDFVRHEKGITLQLVENEDG